MTSLSEVFSYDPHNNLLVDEKNILGNPPIFSSFKESLLTLFSSSVELREYSRAIIFHKSELGKNYFWSEISEPNSPIRKNLLGWLPNAFAEKHSHEGKLAKFTVLQGTLLETRWGRLNGDACERSYRCGESSFLGVDEAHAVHNVGEGIAFSLHEYQAG